MPMINIGHLPPNWMENDHIVQKLGWQMVNLPIEAKNAGANWGALDAGHNPTVIPERIKLLEHLFKYPGRVQSMETIPRGKGPIIVLGSGSSFDIVAPHLKEWNGAVMCSTSHTSTLVYYGRPPDYTVCMDPRVATIDTELDCPDFGDGVLLAHPSVPPSYIEKWLLRAKGNVYLGRIMEPTYDWYSHHLGQMYPWINHVMLPMIDSGAAMLSYATWLGYNPIYMIGIDYGGPRFQRWDYDMEARAWKPDVVTSGYVAGDGGNYSGLTSGGVMAYSSRGSLMSAFMQVANQKYQQCIYNMSTVSALTQFPYAKWEDVRDGGEAQEWTPEQRQKVLDEIEITLAVWETYLVPTSSGFGRDYQTYIVTDELVLVYALLSYNQEIRVNKAEFERIEKQFKGTPMLKLMRAGIVSVEKGDILLRGADEFGDWNWREMEEVDLGPILSQLVGVQFAGPQDLPKAIEKALEHIERESAATDPEIQERVKAKLLGPVLARWRWLVAEGAKRGYKKPPHVRVKLTQKMVDELKAYSEKTPEDEHARLKVLAMEQGLVKVGEELPANGLYPMPMREPKVEVVAKEDGG